MPTINQLVRKGRQQVKYKTASPALQSSPSTTDFNARLQPTAFRLTTNGTGASIIRENYSYFADGRLATLTDLDDSGGSNPPAT